MAQLDLIAAAAFGLESIVADELKTLGYKNKILGNGRVLFRADVQAIARANLWLRCADRVLLRLGTFPAADFGQLFDGIHSLPWEAWLPADAAFPVKGRSVKSQLSSVPACQKIAKKAIVERLLKGHRVPSLPESGVSYVIEVALLNDVATLTLDTTGPGLNKRGYRTLVGEAQLKETLAAALLMLCQWRPEQPLIDPFCGTGTIPIEAALLGRNIAPGANRTFAAESWPAIPSHLWSEARNEAKDLALAKLPRTIEGSDVDAAALRQARFHARAAGVEADVQFHQRDFTALSSQQQQGLILCNPPYGERLSSRREVEALYRAMPAVFNRLPTWSFGVLTSHSRFERLVGAKAASRRKLNNGQIECWFYRYGEQGFSETDDRALQRYQRRGEETPAGQPEQEMFANRLTNRARHLRRWPKRGITCYRLYERDVPEVPLVIDRYEDCLHLVEQPRPHDRSLAEHHRWLADMAAVTGETLGVSSESVFLKRYSDRHEPLAASTSAEPTHVVQEAGMKFHVNLTDFADTGLRLDLRALRAMIRKQAAEKRVLSLFANTGSLAVAAAAGNAASVTAVDPLDVHVRWTQQNLALNGFPQSAVNASPLEFLRQAAAIDLATIEDPPAGDSVALLRAVLERLAADGMVFLVISDRRFKLPQEALGDLHIRDISSQTVPEDFRNRRVHRCWRIARLAAR